MQREIRLLAEITNELKKIDEDLVKRCDTEQAAFRLCINQSRAHRPQQDLADDLGVSRSSLNTILNSDMGERPRYLSRANQVVLQQLCQNTAIDQWAELYGRGRLFCQRKVEDRKAELLKELAELEATA